MISFTCKTTTVFIFLLCIFAFPLKAKEQPRQQDKLVLTSQGVLSYADSLYEQEEYYRAITEYKRLIYFFPKSKVSYAKLQIGRSYMAGEDYTMATDYWKKTISLFPSQSANWRKGMILYGISELDSQQNEVFYFRRNHVAKAIQIFKQLPVTKENKRIHTFTTQWETRDQNNKKSPVVAGVLSSFVPGAGSLYNGRAIEATYAFLMPVLFLGASYQAFHQHKQHLGIFFGFFGLAFYGGNIYAAINGSYKTNEARSAKTLRQLRQQNGIFFFPHSQVGFDRF